MSFIRSQLARRLAALALVPLLAAGCMTDEDLGDLDEADEAALLDDESSVELGIKEGPSTKSFACGENHDVCVDLQSGPQTFPSSERVDRVVGHLQITTGRLRIRIFSSHAGDDRLLYSTTLGPSEQPIRKGVPTAVDRHMRVVIDEVAPGTVYNLWLDFQG
jgi:hypothetical protein